MINGAYCDVFITKLKLLIYIKLNNYIVYLFVWNILSLKCVMGVQAAGIVRL